MKKVFISRDLQPDSIFLQQLEASNFQVHGESLLEFTPVPFSTAPSSDWLFFYSQLGVQYFFDQYQKNQVITPFPYKCAAFGPATAAVIRNFGATPYFIGTGKAESTSDYFWECLSNETVCFVRAKRSRRSVQKLLEGKINAHDLIVYNNTFKEDFSLPHFDVLVFTSPMNASAYFSKYDLKHDQKVVAIGTTTQSTLNELGVKCIVSKLPSEEELALCCLDFFHH